MEGLAVQSKDSQRNTALHSVNSDKDLDKVVNQEAYLWNEVLTPKERAALLDKAGMKETGYFQKWKHFKFHEKYKLRLVIKKAALWQIIAGIH